jgi:hypothetical protein
MVYPAAFLHDILQKQDIKNITLDPFNPALFFAGKTVWYTVSVKRNNLPAFLQQLPHETGTE